MILGMLLQSYIQRWRDSGRYPAILYTLDEVHVWLRKQVHLVRVSGHVGFLSTFDRSVLAFETLLFMASPVALKQTAKTYLPMLVSAVTSLAFSLCLFAMSIAVFLILGTSLGWGVPLLIEGLLSGTFFMHRIWSLGDDSIWVGEE